MGYFWPGVFENAKLQFLDKLEPPTRDINSALRFPISNVFRGQGSGTGITGRVCGGVVQVGDRLRILPGDETGVVKCNGPNRSVVNIANHNYHVAIFTDGDPIPWAAAGQNVTIYMTAVDPIQLNIGSVLCPVNDPIPLATIFTARVIVFDISVPITAGTSVSPRLTLFAFAHM